MHNCACIYRKEFSSNKGPKEFRIRPQRSRYDSMALSRFVSEGTPNFSINSALVSHFEPFDLESQPFLGVEPRVYSRTAG